LRDKLASQEVSKAGDFAVLRNDLRILSFIIASKRTTEARRWSLVVAIDER